MPRKTPVGFNNKNANDNSRVPNLYGCGIWNNKNSKICRKEKWTTKYMKESKKKKNI